MFGFELPSYQGKKGNVIIRYIAMSIKSVPSENTTFSFFGNKFIEIYFTYHTVHSFKVNAWVVFTVVTVMQPSHQEFENTFITRLETPYPLSSHSPLPFPQPLTAAHLLSVSMSLPILDISYKRTHIIFVFLCLASFT